ncbi:MAG TPA: glycosyltransferase, partial [Steroidobacter sp.]|nr:glycosyltransferase [Steroidobacter sp.]
MQKMEDEPTFVAEPVTLCIINFNGVEHLRRAFESIDRQPWRFAEVLLVDNASEDDSVAVARALCPGVRVVQLPANRGPGAARNAGFSAARHDLILFIDNDVRLERETVSALIRRVRVSDGVLAAAPRVVYADRPDTIQFDSADCHFLGLMATRHADQQLGAVEEEAAATTSLVSACFMIDRSRWREGDLFDETLGFNLEDHDFAVRARLAGHELWVEPAARVQHGSGTPGLSYRPGVTVSPQRLYYLTLNRWIVMTKCYSAKTLVLLSPALIAFELMQLAWLTSQGAGRVWLQALRTYRARRAELMVVRAATQRARRIPDGVVLREAGLPMTRGARESFVG